MSLRPLQLRRWFRGRTLRAMLLVLAGISIGALASHLLPGRDQASEFGAQLGTRARSGPWGELYFVPFTIAAPDELLPVHAIETAGTHWVFKNSTSTEISNLLESAGVPDDLRNALLAPEVAHAGIMDIKLTPTPGMVFALPSKARLAIYRKLAQFPENRTAFAYIHKDTLRDRFDNSGVSKDTLALFRQFCCEHGDYLVLGGLPALLSKLPGYEEKMRLMKALTRQKTMFVQLRLTKDSDIETLVNYWSKGCWAPKVRTLLESVDRVPGGTFTSIMALLPPLPASQLYSYPIVQSSAASGQAVIHDCHWTSLNFFRDTSDTISVDSDRLAIDLTTNFYPISGEPHFGDIIVLEKLKGEIIHSAVFIADEIVFTKNGATPIYPWMLSTIPDLLKQYSFQAPEGHHLAVRYFRKKGV